VLPSGAVLRKPVCAQRGAAAPRPMRARLRTAWNATCAWFARLHADVAARALRLEGVEGEVGEVDEGVRRRARPARSSAPAPTRTSGSAAPGRCRTTPRCRPAWVHARIRSRSSRRPLTSRSKDAKWRCSGCGVVIPAWCSPWNATTSSRAAACPPAGRRPAEGQAGSSRRGQAPTAPARRSRSRRERPRSAAATGRLPRRPGPSAPPGRRAGRRAAAYRPARAPCRGRTPGPFGTGRAPPRPRAAASARSPPARAAW